MSALKRHRLKMKLSQAALARLAGTSQPQILRLENGDREMTKTWAEQLAPFLNVLPEELLFPELSSFARIVKAPILGVIQAGVWLEAEALPEPESIPIVDTEGYADDALYVLRVKGDSMDQYVADGGYVVCVDAYKAHVQFRQGMIVHVERKRNGGLMTETTLKEIGSDKGKMVLIPRSSNPAHKLLQLDADGADSVEIRGLIVGRYEPAPVR